MFWQYYTVLLMEKCVQLFELCCLSEPGYVDFLVEYIQKYGTIARLWIGPYVGVMLTEAKYVEVSEVPLAL
jgi:hypothetical protein